MNDSNQHHCLKFKLMSGTFDVAKHWPWTSQQALYQSDIAVNVKQFNLQETLLNCPVFSCMTFHNTKIYKLRKTSCIDPSNNTTTNKNMTSEALMCHTLTHLKALCMHLLIIFICSLAEGAGMLLWMPTFHIIYCTHSSKYWNSETDPFVFAVD